MSRKPAISLKRGKVRPRLVLRTNRKSRTRFQFVPKLMTSDDLERLIRTLAEKMHFTESSRKNRMKIALVAVEEYLYCAVKTEVTFR